MTLNPTPIPNTFIVPGRFPRIVTRNLTPGKRFFENEETWFEDGMEFRQLDPGHSKLGAAIAKGCQQYGLREGSRVLYLGASHGYTPSFVSDMVGKSGMVFCLDVAPRVVRDLVFVCEARSNMMPLLADANDPGSFAWRITSVDVVFQDIAQRDQVGIFLKNVMAFVQPGGFGMLAVKARSIDVTKRPMELFKEIKRTLDSTPGIAIVDYRELDPFEKDHAFFVVKRK
ncbi:TPA: fibrillarin-like rRNA/tRNA 2'-O-methyltransferase [Candidatus Woesearchaeota archaeon]|nr:fibrillarin-like rRNA/tRNA 2'-O-methyltransferase [Candidatus Woesearchaeota archaeon]